MSRGHPVVENQAAGLPFVSDWIVWISVRDCNIVRRERGRTGLVCSNRTRVSAEQASRIHLIRGNGSPSTL